MLLDASSGKLMVSPKIRLMADTQSSLSDNNRARQALRQCLPEPLRDATFSNVLRDDAATKRCLAQLLINLSDTVSDTQNDQFE